MPESRIILSQTAIYLSCSEKSNSSYKAINKAQEEVMKSGNLQVPIHLTNSDKYSNTNKKDEYKYTHDFNNNFINQEYLPDKIKAKKIYNPGENKREKKYKVLLEKLWKNKYDY